MGVGWLAQGVPPKTGLSTLLKQLLWRNTPKDISPKTLSNSPFLELENKIRKYIFGEKKRPSV